MLEIGQAFESLLHHTGKFLKVPFSLMMGFPRIGVVDAPEHATEDVADFKPESLERIGHHNRGEEPAQCLLGAAIGVVNQVWQRVEHGPPQGSALPGSKPVWCRPSVLWAVQRLRELHPLSFFRSGR